MMKYLLLFMLPLMAGCSTHKYLHYDTKYVKKQGYEIEPVLESTALEEKQLVNGVWVEGGYPIFFRFFIEAKVAKDPVRFAVSNARLKGLKTGRVVAMKDHTTKKVNRPLPFEKDQKTLTMHFVMHKFTQEELPFEDYELTCRVRIEEKNGNVIEEDLKFIMKSKMMTGINK